MAIYLLCLFVHLLYIVSAWHTVTSIATVLAHCFMYAL